jgi:hypothetical protein
MLVTGGRCVLATDVEHLRAQIRRRHAAGGPDPARDLDDRITGSAGEIEDTHPWLEASVRQERVAHVDLLVRDLGVPVRPCAHRVRRRPLVPHNLSVSRHFVAHR